MKTSNLLEIKCKFYAKGVGIRTAYFWAPKKMTPEMKMNDATAYVVSVQATARPPARLPDIIYRIKHLLHVRLFILNIYYSHIVF